jgi:hypothetical protein
VLLAVEHVVVVGRPFAAGAGFRGAFEGEHIGVFERRARSISISNRSVSVSAPPIRRWARAKPHA